MPELDQQAHLKLIETELRNALHAVASLQRLDAVDTNFFFQSAVIISNAEKVLQYATELKTDVERRIPVVNPPKAD